MTKERTAVSPAPNPHNWTCGSMMSGVRRAQDAVGSPRAAGSSWVLLTTSFQTESGTSSSRNNCGNKG